MSKKEIRETVQSMSSEEIVSLISELKNSLESKKEKKYEKHFPDIEAFFNEGNCFSIFKEFSTGNTKEVYYMLNPYIDYDKSDYFIAVSFEKCFCVRFGTINSKESFSFFETSKDIYFENYEEFLKLMRKESSLTFSKVEKDFLSVKEKFVYLIS